MSSPSTCSEPCNGGIAYRVVQCVAYKNGQPVGIAPDARCSLPKPDHVTCNTQACAVATAFHPIQKKTQWQ